VNKRVFIFVEDNSMKNMGKSICMALVLALALLTACSSVSAAETAAGAAATAAAAAGTAAGAAGTAAGAAGTAAGAAATAETAATVIKMKMTSDYDDSDPFINEKLFYVTDDTDRVNFEVVFQLEAESGLLEIADNETEDVIWSKAWNESSDDKFDISLSDLDKEKEYVIRLTCTKVENAKIVMTSDNSLVKERARPLKPNRD
jgi:hypothetical protein